MDSNGLIDLADLERLVDESVSVVAVMAANNETGVIMPTDQIAAIAGKAGALMFADVTQLVGKRDLESVSASADLMVCSSHKIYGPKGAGALIAGRQVQKSLVPIASGGGQERGLRGGTHNTPAIVGFGLAAELAAKEQSGDTARIGRLTREFLAALEAQVPDIEVNGVRAERLSNTLNIRFRGADAEAVMTSMPEIQVSAGSACQSAMPTPSHVLLAMGRTSLEAAESLRFSLGRPTTSDEIQTAATSVAAAVDRVRGLTRVEGN
ncbi:cysteine desulfurase [Mycolicibacter heraklionensis]|nr:cysteine desulfurase [Mycolicibacter heraklionensis]